LKLADSNILVALAVAEHQHHDTASEWLTAQISFGEVAICRATQTALLRLLTTKSVMNGYGSRPLTNREAWDVYQGLLADRRITYLQEPPNVDQHWQRLAVREMSSPKLWMDAYLAAFAVGAGCELVTFDSAFQQFDGLILELLPAISA